jgi:SAM-dependent methyltransferase
MPSTFNAHDAESYERVMGRWSRRLAPGFLAFSGIEAGAVLDVGCGTGSLTFHMAESRPAITAIKALDIAPSYVEFARTRNADPRITFDCADAGNLPHADNSFDHAVTLLALHLMTEPEQAVREMARVTRAGGTLAAAVWDVRGGLPHARLFLDTAAMFDPDAIAMRARYMTVPLAKAGELASLWRDFGLFDVVESAISIRFEFDNFADYWQPFTTGEGTMGGYVASLSASERDHLRKHVKAAYESGAPDGTRSFAAWAWTVRGTVDKT